MTPAPGPPGTTLTDEPDADEWRRRAEEYRAAGRVLDALEALTLANRERSAPDLERDLVRTRHEGFRGLKPHGAATWPVHTPGRPLSLHTPLPVVGAAELTPQLLATAIFGHGALHVRGIVDRALAADLVEGIDRAMAAAEQFESGASVDDTTPWFEPFRPEASYPIDMKKQVGNRRKWVREAGGVWTADSPHMMFRFFETLEQTGLRKTITEYLGERPALAVDKCTLRRVGLDTGTDWHQDGAFLGTGPTMRTVNVWMSLSDCGVDAPGLDVVPARLDRIVETGTDGAEFQWSVGPGAVDRVVEQTGAPVFRPVFEAGDALIFDEIFLHRTAIDASMTKARYAIETWFFAPSLYPEKYVPLIV